MIQAVFPWVVDWFIWFSQFLCCKFASFEIKLDLSSLAFTIGLCGFIILRYIDIILSLLSVMTLVCNIYYYSCLVSFQSPLGHEVHTYMMKVSSCCKGPLSQLPVFALGRFA